MSLPEFMQFIANYILTVAGDDQLRTIYHDRIDGYLLPACAPQRMPR